MAKAIKNVTSTKATGDMVVQAETWDGPHFRLVFCGLNDFKETPPPHALFLDAMEPLGCWEYVLSGAIYYKVGTERYRIDAGEALITRRPDPGWMIRPVKGVPVQTLWLTVKDEMALRMFDYLHMKYGHIQQFQPNSPVVRLAKQLVRLVREEPHRPAHFWSLKTFQWMNSWWQCAQQHHASWNRVSLDALKPNQISQTPHTIKNFASQMGYSRSYLTRKLTQQWKRSPGVVLREVRLQEAAILLRSTQLSIGEIATRVGYGAAAAFGRAFMQQYKMSPRAYRHTQR